MYMKLLLFVQKNVTVLQNFLLYYIFIRFVKSQFDTYPPLIWPIFMQK